MTATDYTKREGADILACRIKDYWKAKGYKVKVHKTYDRVGQFDYYTIRSDMIDGLPYRMKPQPNGDS